MESLNKRLENLEIFEGGTVLEVTTQNSSGAEQYASQLKFLMVKVKMESKISHVPIVVKIQPEHLSERLLFHSDKQFSNEVTMYREVIPFLKSQLDVFPKFLYGEATNGQNYTEDIVILEDMRPLGYRPGEGLNLDYEHAAISLSNLGKFHGLSYKAKKGHRTKFDGLSSKLLRSELFSDELNEVMLHVLDRGFKVAREKNVGSKVLQEVMEKITYHGYKQTLSKLLSPVEPYAVITHGDFNKNNLMYKYDNRGEVVGLKILDFQNSVYADPTMDLALLLYMNTSQENRNIHWDDFLQIYWNGLTSIEPDPDFTFETFLENFRKKAVYGYFPCSFYLPILLNCGAIDPIPELMEMDFSSKLNRYMTYGGEVGTCAVGDIVQDLLDRGYLECFLRNFK